MTGHHLFYISVCINLRCLEEITEVDIRSLILAKVYSNSLLLILNNRTYLVADVQRSNNRNALGSAQGQYSSGALNMGVLRPKAPIIDRTRGIQVDMKTSVHLDHEMKRPGSSALVR